MDRNKNDQVIFIKDLLFSALYSWRWIIAIALVFALILGGITGIEQWKAASDVASEETVKAAMVAYENKKQLLIKAEEDAQKMVDSQEEYNLNSAIMSLDPYNVFKATVSLTVLANNNAQDESADTAAAILQAYAAHLSSDKVVDAMAAKLKMESKYLTELVDMANGGVDTKCLTITVSYPNKEGAETILSMLKTEVENASTEVSKTLGKHTYSYVASVDERIDLSIIDKQEQAIKRLDTLRAALTTAQQQHDSLPSPSFGVTASVKKVTVFAILGAFLGATLVAGCACVLHILNNKVYSARVLKNRTDLRILGCVPAMGKRNPIDKWLRKLEGRSLGENCLAVATGTVKNYCADAQNVLIVGDCAQTDMEPIAEALKKLQVNVTLAGSLLRDPGAPEKLPACDCVLLIEKCGCSSYANILLTAERIADQNKPLLGCVLVEG